MGSRVRISPMDATNQFQQFLLSVGFDLTGHNLRMDGKWHNVRLQGQRGYAKSGGYRGWADDFPQGQYINHRTGEQGRWHPEGERIPISRAEAANLERIWRDREAARRADERERHEAKAAKAELLLRRALPADPSHPYLLRKRIRAYGIYQVRDVLIVPLSDPADGRVWSVQFISRYGEKLPLTGARKVGLSFVIGKAKDGEEIGIAEGYSTTASVHFALGIPVAMAMTAEIYCQRPGHSEADIRIA